MVKLVVLVLIFAVIITFLKNFNSELALIATIVAGIILISFALDYISDAFNVFNQLVEMSSIDKDLFVVILKITGIGYLIEFAADTVSDFGLKNLADKLVFVGKIMIFSISIPIFYAIINLLTGLLTWKLN